MIPEVRLTPNAAHPNDSTPVVTLSLVKEALRLPSDITDEDNYLRLLIDSFEIAIEKNFDLILRSRQYVGYLPCFSSTSFIVLPRPISSAPTITYSAKDLTTKSVTLTDFISVPKPTIFIKDVATINADLNPDKIAPITITATCGSSSVPKNAQTLIVQGVAYLYQNREASITNNNDAQLAMINHFLQPLNHILNNSVY